MYAILLKIDRDLKLAPGTTRRVYTALVENQIVQKEQEKETKKVTDEFVDSFRKKFNKAATKKARLMSDKLSVRAALEDFLVYHDYTEAEMLSAAERYVLFRLQSDRPDLIMHCNNFIKSTKQDGTTFSRLSEYCEDPSEDLTFIQKDNFI